jgi:hypothetical protein
MKWSVALFGHYKPRYYVQEQISGQWLNSSTWVEHPGDLPKGMRLHVCEGASKRAEPGDVIATKPEKCWMCDRQQHAEIVGLLKNKGYLLAQKEAIKARHLATFPRLTWRHEARFERIWKERYEVFGLSDPALLPEDIKGYFSYLPGASLWHINGRDVWGESERRLFLLTDIDGPEPDQLDGLMEPQWDTNSYREYRPVSIAEFKSAYKGKGDPDKEYEAYLEMEKQACSMPAAYIKKRRVNIPLDTLRSAGVDIDAMLDPNIKYVPDVELPHTQCFDKVKSRTLLASDQLRTIQPIDPTTRGGA